MFYAIRRKRLYFALALLRVRSQTKHSGYELSKVFIAAYFTETMPQIKAALSTVILYADYARNARQFSLSASLHYRQLAFRIAQGSRLHFCFCGHCL